MIDYEKDAKENGLSSRRVTKEIIEQTVVREQYYVFPDSTLTVCMLTLTNGFTVTGESACADPANFRQELGEKYAKEAAMQKIWPLEGYLLKEALYQIGIQHQRVNMVQGLVNSGNVVMG